MTVSVEEALSIFQKWLSEGSAIRLVFKTPSVEGVFTGRVFAVTDESVGISPPGELPREEIPDSLFRVSLVLAHSFAFSDPRDAGSDRESLAEEMNFSVMIFYSTGERCILYELATH